MSNAKVIKLDVASWAPNPAWAVEDPYAQWPAAKPPASARRAQQKRTPQPYPGPLSPPHPGALDPRMLDAQVAPPPQIERYPIISGRALTMEVVSQRFRLALTGYRQLYVDLLNELIERDPHAFGIMQKRVLAVANATINVRPAELPAKTGKRDAKRAQELAETFSADLKRIPRLRQHLAFMAWADYYGLQGLEIVWAHERGHWRPSSLTMVHSRRLSYPDPWRWDLYIWDQGAVLGSPDGRIHHPPGVFGWKVSDYPGKFIVHAPQVRGDYPTREGLGRELAYWMVLKHIAARSAPQYLERFGSPPVDITYVTGKEGQPGRPASREDIDDAKAAASAEAVRKWAHPDTIKWELKAPDGAGGRAKVTFPEWIDICDSQMSKAVLGGTLTTDVGSSGSRALGGTQRKDQMTVIAHSANTLADSLDEGLVRTWGELNAPDRPDLWPHIELSVEDKADPADIMERAVRAASVGLPVDADKLGEMVALPLVAVDDEKARVIRPVSPTPPTEAPHAPMTGTNNPEASAQRAKEAQAQMASQGLGPDGKPLTTEPDEGDDDTENDEGDEPTTDDDEES